MTYIDPRGKVLRHLDRLAAWQAGGRAAPVTVEWDLSNRCSLGCMDCHFAHTHSKGPWTARLRVLPQGYAATGDLADEALVRRGVAEMAAAGVRGLIWSGGGEPTLHPRFLEIVHHAGAQGLQQGLYTLGGHLSEAAAEALGRALTFVVVSLDAVDAQTYARDKGVPAARFGLVLRTVAALSGAAAAPDRPDIGDVSETGHGPAQSGRESALNTDESDMAGGGLAADRTRARVGAGRPGAAVGVSHLLHEGNWRRAEAMVALTRRLGATYTTLRPAVRFDPAHPAAAQGDRGWVTEALPLLRSLAKEPDVEADPERFEAWRDWAGHGYDTCLGVRVTATVTPDGQVWVCPNRRGVPGSAIGDLRRESFADVWGRHTGAFAVDADCRALCRLHLMNQTLAAIERPRAHEAFL